MGIVNVTPDSFSDGGLYFNPEKAIAHGAQLAQEGASILDIGAESTRPGAVPVAPEEEIRRVIPVIEGLKRKSRWISVDTRNSATMEAALKAGANAINDISSLSYDPRSVSVVAEAKVPVFFMHMQGNPQTMQEKPFYNNVLKDVFEYLKQRITFFETNRIDEKNLIADPGIGFGKTLEHNLLILRNISQFHDLGVPIMVGASRKSFIEKICGDIPAHDRLGGSLSTALWTFSQGVQFFRVHDVKETVQALKVYASIADRGKR